jgi:hypothetical protein
MSSLMPSMIECRLLLLALLRAAVRARGDLVAENLLLRHQLAVLTRPTRTRPRLRARDKLLRLLARLACRDWRRHLVVVRPETVVRWLTGPESRSHVTPPVRTRGAARRGPD